MITGIHSAPGPGVSARISAVVSVRIPGVMETRFANQRLLQGSFGRLNAYAVGYRKRCPLDTEEQLHEFPSTSDDSPRFPPRIRCHLRTSRSHLDSRPGFPEDR